LDWRYFVTQDPQRLFDQAFGCKHPSRNLILAAFPGSLRLEPELLDDGPPFLGVGLDQCAERLRRLLLARENFSVFSVMG
jgi:hypothetical protein